MDNRTKDRLAIILLDSYEGLEYKHKASVLSLYKNAGDIFDDVSLAVEYIANNLGASAANTIERSFNFSQAEYILNKLNKKNVTVITCKDEEYPSYILNYPLYPLALYAKGNIGLLKADRKFSIVGSRKTMPFALKATESIARTLSENSVVIVTGSALGGDRSAILGSVKSGNVISVLAHGTDHIYPESNRSLIEKVEETGLVISEYPPETPPAAWRYPIRNRIIAALGDGLLVSSGSTESGTRHTAKFAEAYSKRIYAFPYSLGETSGEICNLLIKLGKASLVENAEDIALCEGIRLKDGQTIELTERERELLSAIDGKITVDELCIKTGKKAFEIIPLLSMLEIKGVVAKENGNSYVAIIKI